MFPPTFVAFHDDPYRRADTSVDELEREQLSRHFVPCYAIASFVFGWTSRVGKLKSCAFAPRLPAPESLKLTPGNMIQWTSIILETILELDALGGGAAWTPYYFDVRERR